MFWNDKHEKFSAYGKKEQGALSASRIQLRTGIHNSKAHAAHMHLYNSKNSNLRISVAA